MAEHSKIEWTDATWNPITGCSVVSPGCTNCYAMRLAGGRLKNHPSRAGLTTPSKAGPVWNGKVRFNDDWLEQPLRWRRPRMIFVCAHGDLFHEEIPGTWIDAVIEVMLEAHWHTFQVLTKRPDRARGVFKLYASNALRPYDWPLENVWLGTSVEDQTRADERLPHLAATSAAIRFVSAEPLLGPLNLSRWLTKGIDWVIVGGESGAQARPMNPGWAAGIKHQCESSGVPFFMKQMAKKALIPDDLMVRQFPTSSFATEDEDLADE